MNCIVCKMHLENFDNGEVNHPKDAVVFIARGNYGSTVFDPMDGSYLEVNICDDCVKLARHDSMVMIGPPQSRSELKLWTDND